MIEFWYLNIFFLLFSIHSLFFKVLGNGRILEFDTPTALLSNPNSQFTQLVEQTGTAESEYLRNLANISTKVIKKENQSSNSDDESTPEETDPLLSSHEKNE